MANFTATEENLHTLAGEFDDLYYYILPSYVFDVPFSLVKNLKTTEKQLKLRFRGMCETTESRSGFSFLLIVDGCMSVASAEELIQAFWEIKRDASCIFGTHAEDPLLRLEVDVHDLEDPFSLS